MRSTWVSRSVLSSTFLACLLAPAILHSEARPITQEEVQIAFLYNFAKFVQWPPETFAQPNEPFTLCVMGKNTSNRPFEAQLKEKTIQDKPLVVKRISSPEQAMGCHELFISEDEKWGPLSKTLERSPVLTVGEQRHFAEQGGMIEFIMEQNHVRFNINQTAAEQAHLKIGSDLLKLARKVQ